MGQDIVGHNPVLGGLEMDAVGGLVRRKASVLVGETGPEVHQIALLLPAQLGQRLVQPLDVRLIEVGSVRLHLGRGGEVQDVDRDALGLIVPNDPDHCGHILLQPVLGDTDLVDPQHNIDLAEVLLSQAVRQSAGPAVREAEPAAAGNIGGGDSDGRKNTNLTVYEDLSKRDIDWNYTEFIAKYAKLVNSDGVYEVNAELKLFLERYLNQRYTDITSDTAKPNQPWLLGCGYYA